MIKDENNRYFLNNNTFSGNEAISLGGAIKILNGKGNISSCLFINNVASYGGAIYLTNDKLYSNNIFFEYYL